MKTVQSKKNPGNVAWLMTEKDLFGDEPMEPRKVVRRLLEKDVQKSCVAWYRGHRKDGWARKFSSPAQRSVPDYLFGCKLPTYQYRDVRIKFFVEFKRPGEVATDAQIDEQRIMRFAGWDGMQDCDSLDRFKEWVIAYEHAQSK